MKVMVGLLNYPIFQPYFSSYVLAGSVLFNNPRRINGEPKSCKINPKDATLLESAKSCKKDK